MWSRQAELLNEFSPLGFQEQSPDHGTCGMIVRLRLEVHSPRRPARRNREAAAAPAVGAQFGGVVERLAGWTRRRVRATPGGAVPPRRAIPADDVTFSFARDLGISAPMKTAVEIESIASLRPGATHAASRIIIIRQGPQEVEARN
jgi:hypothetical protein